MNQRRPRLGDILDDYCPRERRITNHAVVAMVEDDVKQTRCTTCDAEHEYKHAKVPASRKRKTETRSAHLVEGASRPATETPDVHDDANGAEMSVVDLHAGETEAESVQREADQNDAFAPESESEHHAELAAAADGVDDAESTDEEGRTDSDEWPVHRRLIRAQLPRPEGQVPERKAPDFTFRPGGKFDQHRNNGQRHRGHRPARHAQSGGGQSSGQGQRFGGQRGPGGGHGGPHGQRQGNRSGQGGSRPGQGQGQGRGPRPGGGRKRGR